MDAFFRALTNWLPSDHVWGNADNRQRGVTKKGLIEIEPTQTLRDMVDRNATGLGGCLAGMTCADGRRS